MTYYICDGSAKNRYIGAGVVRVEKGGVVEINRVGETIKRFKHFKVPPFEDFLFKKDAS